MNADDPGRVQALYRVSARERSSATADAAILQMARAQARESRNGTRLSLAVAALAVAGVLWTGLHVGLHDTSTDASSQKLPQIAASAMRPSPLATRSAPALAALQPWDHFSACNLQPGLCVHLDGRSDPSPGIQND
jgi:hypothetical protein